MSQLTVASWSWAQNQLCLPCGRNKHRSLWLKLEVVVKSPDYKGEVGSPPGERGHGAVSEWKGCSLPGAPVNVTWTRLGGSGLTVLQAKKRFVISMSFDHLFNSHLFSAVLMAGLSILIRWFKNWINNPGISLVIQWLRLCLPNQECRFGPWSGNWDPTYHRYGGKWAKININK